MPKIDNLRNYLALNEIRESSLWNAVIAEFFGTLFLVLVCCASCIEDWGNGYKSTEVQIAFTFGILVATMVQCLCHVSGGHINPTVTFGLLVARHISITRAILYVIIQCTGAIVGVAILFGIVPSDFQGSFGTTVPNDSINSAQAFGVEFLITFVLILTVFAVWDEARNDVKGSANLAIGLPVTGCHLAAIPITGSSMNPARSLGSSVISGIWDYHWLYCIGPFTGGIIASFLYTYLFRQKRQKSWRKTSK